MLIKGIASFKKKPRTQLLLKKAAKGSLELGLISIINQSFRSIKNIRRILPPIAMLKFIR